MLYYNPRHVSSSTMLIFRRSYCIITASGIVTHAWPRIIMFRRLRDGNPCLKGQLEDLKHVGKKTFWKI